MLVCCEKLPPGASDGAPQPEPALTTNKATKSRDETRIAQWHAPRPREDEACPPQLPVRRPRPLPTMRVSQLLCTVAHVFVCTVNANVEKVVFLGPSPVALAAVPNAPPSLDALRLDSLSPALGAVVATQLPVRFPSAPAPRGLESWYLLRGLEDRRRYEVRICWPATVSLSLPYFFPRGITVAALSVIATRPCLPKLTLPQQPTDFWLDTYSIAQVFDTPDLLSSLARYSDQRQELQVTDAGYLSEHLPPATQSTLFLRVQAAASYYSTNRTLMEHPLPVHVDISMSNLPHQAPKSLTSPVLDPYILNILPRSLAPTAAYITLVAIGAWFLSGFIYRWLLLVAIEPPQKPHAD